MTRKSKAERNAATSRLWTVPAPGAIVRVGSANRQADEELIAKMPRFSLGQSFDERPMPDLDSEAIDFRAASESFAEYRQLAQRDLEILRLCTKYQGRSVPTVGGILRFGRDRIASTSKPRSESIIV